VTAFALVEGDSAQAEEVLINETLDETTIGLATPGTKAAAHIARPKCS
jgi:hypothetical protein